MPHSARERAGEPRFGYVSWQVEIDEAVGGANLNFGVFIVRGLAERIKTGFRPDLDNRLDGFDADISIGIAQILRKRRNGLGISFAEIADAEDALICVITVFILAKGVQRNEAEDQRHDAKRTEEHIVKLTETGLADNFDGYFVRNETCFKAEIEQLLRGARYDISAINGVVIDVHAYELLRQRGFQIAGELHGIV